MNRQASCSNCSGRGELSLLVSCPLCLGNGFVIDTVGHEEITENYLCLKNTSKQYIQLVLWYGYSSFSGEDYRVYESMRIKTVMLSPNQSECIHQLRMGTLNIRVNTNPIEYQTWSGYYFNTFQPGFNSSVFINRGKNVKNF